jgi:hypothetical protein
LPRSDRFHGSHETPPNMRYYESFKARIVR